MYQHQVQYYETDMMGITHHSNYIRWMEEARADYLARIGWPYDRLEADGIISPVVSVQCSYKQTTSFPDLVGIAVTVRFCRGAKLGLAYTMTKADGSLVCQAESEHGFIDRQGSPVNLKKTCPGFYQALTEAAQAADKG